MKLGGKIAVVTGGSRGIGLATAVVLGKQGCRVVICGKTKAHLDTAKKVLEKYGDSSAFVCDVSKPEEIRKFASAVGEKFGSVDILVNNAGVAYYKRLADTSEEEIKNTMDVNVRGLVLMTKHLLPLMPKNGIIINISSAAGKEGYAGLTAYCASKFAVLGFTESLGKELKQKVVAVCPGGVDTDMYMATSARHPALKPEHIASKIAEVCTEPQKFISGSSVEVYHFTDAINRLKLRYFGKK